ncbi:hypothetical protein QUF90_01685 [Desulfococcaceae bacterium HSG9]|nr:hypothetical protein [Desulfococcaceae bacterium HSG9]
MAHGITPSEKFVTALCERAFIRLWTHPNPKGKKNKELCDCLIVCGPHIVIISVKKCEYKNTGNKTGWKRWEKAAIEKSASQIWGAERWLQTVDQFVRLDGRRISLPAKSERKYHRISVSLGGRGHVPIKWGNLGKGFIHVCDEYSIGVVFNALDTITDFVEFLDSIEVLIASGVQMLFAGGGIEDIVALYLLNGRSFNFSVDSNKQADMVIIHNDLWKNFYESNDYKAIQKEFQDSYIWDRLIEHYVSDLLTEGMFDMHSKEVTDNDLALITMALQPRGIRAVLAELFMEFLQNPELKVASRAVKGYADTAFVFLIGKSSDREYRARELALRCLVIRGRLKGVKTVVGIATDRPGTSEIGYSSDIVYIHMPEWTAENETQVSGIQADLGYFQNTQ